MIVVASTIRYRKEIRLLQAFDVTTRLVTWDSQALYLENQFIRPADNFILAVSLTKYRVLSTDTSMSPSVLLSALDPAGAIDAPPPAPAELRAWQEYDQLSSQALRPRV